MEPTQKSTKNMAPTTDFFVFPRMLDAMSPTTIPNGGAVQLANQVPTTIPQLLVAGRVRSRRLPNRGMNTTKTPVKHRVFG